MHVALIVDEERLAQEHSTLNRLSIGLMSEGVRLTRVIPETLATSVDEVEQRMALATKLVAPMPVLPWMRGDRSSRLAEALDRDPPDVLYAVGQAAWGVGRDLAEAIDRPLALDLCSAAQVRHAPRGRGWSMVAGYIAPTAPLGQALRQRVEEGLVCVVPMGVAVPDAPRSILVDADNSIALAVVGGGRDVRSYQALLTGLARVIRDLPQVQVFLELNGPNEHEIWRHARRLDLLEFVTAIPDASRLRSLLTRCDVLLMPEQYGELRSLTLEAMTFAMPVVASEDPYLDMLIDGETASVVRSADPEAWSRPLMRLLTQPEVARDMGAAARALMSARHRSSDQVTRLIAAFERITGGGAYAFEP